MKKIIVSIFCGLLFLPAIALAAFTANGNITVSQVAFGSGFADLMILSGSASDSWSFNSGVFSITNPGVFKVGSADATVKSIIVNNGSSDVVCAPNSVPGTSYVTLPTAAGTYTVEPSATADCCPAVNNAATHNPFPTCGAASCASGFSLSGGQCVAVVSSGGGGGSQPKAPITPAKTTENPLGIFQITINDGAANTADRQVTLKLFGGSDTTKMAVSNTADFNSINLENYQSTEQWDLCAGFNVCSDGNYTVYAKFYNAAGVASGVVSAQIGLNTSAAPSPAPVAPTEGTANLNGASAQLVEQVTSAEVQILENVRQLPVLSAVNQKVFDSVIKLTTIQLTEAVRMLIAQFVQVGTPSTLIIGAGERGGSIASFASAFGRLPQSPADWQDVIKIANGRWPGQKSQAAEDRAKLNFKIVYGRQPKMTDIHDNAAVTIMAYGLRPAQRSLGSEKAAIKAFRFFYQRSPVTAREWDVVRAIAYGGAKR